MDTERLNSNRIIFPEEIYREMIEHCQRKLAGDYLQDEAHEPKAYGLIGGSKCDEGIEIKSCMPLKKNFRTDEKHKDHMNQVMNDHAIPSVTPFKNRGWVADPDEMMVYVRKLQEIKCTLIGTYHMHRVPWDHDQKRDTPTELDTILGKNSRLIMFIISMVDPDNPITRAFSEGDICKELPVSFGS